MKSVFNCPLIFGGSNFYDEAKGLFGEGAEMSFRLRKNVALKNIG